MGLMLQLACLLVLSLAWTVHSCVHTMCSGVRYQDVRVDVCCLETDGICCNCDDATTVATDFFCCPQALPICDCAATTCRAEPSSVAVVLEDTGYERESVLLRAYQKKPGKSYQGTSLPHSSTVLNGHLVRNIESHGHDAEEKLSSCSELTLPELHDLQRTMFDMRLPSLDVIYQSKNDNRRLQLTTRAEYEDLWGTELLLALQNPSVAHILRDGRCHEAIMWYVHHLENSQQQAVLDKVGRLPLLPEIAHFSSDEENSDPPFNEVEPTVLKAVRRSYTVSVGCGACHIQPKASTLPASATQCTNANDQCMGKYRLWCNNNSSAAPQCCERDSKGNPLTCQPVFVPATDIRESVHTTMCVIATSKTLSADVPKPVTAVTAVTPHAPVLPKSWRAKGKYYNTSSDDPTTSSGTASFLFQEDGIGNQTTLRVDFSPSCPFYQLWELGLESNYGNCSVIYRNNTVSYVYHIPNVQCTYCSEDAISPWHRDFLCESGSDYTSNLTLNIAGKPVTGLDLWRNEWIQYSFLVLRNSRNWYFKPNSNIPVRVSEDLDTGYTDFTDFEIVPSPGILDQEFVGDLKGFNTSFIAGTHGTSECVGPDERQFLKDGENPPCVVVHGINVRRANPLPHV